MSSTGCLLFLSSFVHVTYLRYVLCTPRFSVRTRIYLKRTEQRSALINARSPCVCTSFVFILALPANTRDRLNINKNNSRFHRNISLKYLSRKHRTYAMITLVFTDLSLIYTYLLQYFRFGTQFYKTVKD